MLDFKNFFGSARDVTSNVPTTGMLNKALVRLELLAPSAHSTPEASMQGRPKVRAVPDPSSTLAEKCQIWAGAVVSSASVAPAMSVT